MKALVFGSNGYFGSNICSSFKQIEVIPDFFTDISNFGHVNSVLQKQKPDIVINCAAKVNEDEAESNIQYWQEMIKANLLGAINCLKSCQINNVKYCHIKTPFEVSPIDDYSLSKVSASSFIDAQKYESMTLKILPGWLFGGKNSRQFDTLLIKSVKQNIPLGITNNSYSTPTYMPDFCERLENLLLDNTTGTRIISATEGCTRYEFAKCLSKIVGQSMNDLRWTENNNFPEKAKRPSDWRILGDLPSYQERMKDFLIENKLSQNF